jgi:hypothetical protein
MGEHDLDSLQAENETLRVRLRDLEAELLFLKSHPVLLAGLRGEQIICQAVNGVPTSYAASYDVALRCGKMIEVKYSNLHVPNKGRPMKRWNWSKPLGSLDRGKDYDYLVLVGEKDARFKNQYLDDTPFVYFLIPVMQVKSVMTKGVLAGGNIQISTDIKNVASPAQVELKKYLVSYQKITALAGEDSPLPLI